MPWTYEILVDLKDYHNRHLPPEGSSERDEPAAKDEQSSESVESALAGVVPRTSEEVKAHKRPKNNAARYQKRLNRYKSESDREEKQKNVENTKKDDEKAKILK